MSTSLGLLVHPHRLDIEVHMRPSAHDDSPGHVHTGTLLWMDPDDLKSPLMFTNGIALPDPDAGSLWPIPRGACVGIRAPTNPVLLVL
jgi:hypothetical protein